MFLLRRLARLAASLAALLAASFSMIHLIPGDPVRAALGATAPAELVAARRAELGLDQPIHEQLLAYVKGVLTGDLGTSFQTKEAVAGVIADRLPSTVELAVLASLIALLVAVPLGVWLAIRTHNGRNPGSELAFTTATGTVAAIPEFLLSVGLVVVFSTTLGWLPPAGKDGPASYVLPVLALTVGPIAILSRLIRVEALRELDMDYMRMARAKHLTGRRLYLRHLLPNTLTATLTVAGLLLASLIPGTVLVENVFAWPGLGQRMTESILQKDYPVAQAVILVYGAVVLLVNFLVDVALGVLDPRSAIRGT
ncbi:ABC transporter permease [Nonomuraea pusilla]|uniref:ABC transporter permease n=1 Tax=Nonomuraea pusilla TaxID=46177 RepID=UPI00331D3615